ncbi:MAG: hypothetical protein DRJ45_01120 [Thermoprotei archaeon]|nr:MAG: hypothetical protein DRJ45_01120 [Thermoprotei archaeon]
MIRLLNLSVRNFRKLNISIDFPQGILVITGPNESGKSTILEAILYSLFGELMRGKKDDAIRYDSSISSLKLVFAVNKDIYRVERKIEKNSPSIARLYKVDSNGNIVLIATTPSAVNKEIRNILGGLSYKEFLASNIVAQKDLEKIVNMKRGERNAIINAFLNLDSYTKAIENLKEDRKRIGGTKTLKGELTIAKEYLKNLREIYNRYIDSIRELANIDIEIKKYMDRKKILEKMLDETSSLYTILRQYREILSKRKEIENNLEKLNIRLEELKKNLSEIARKKEELKKIREEIKKYMDIDEKIELIKSLEKRVREKNDLKNETKNILLKIEEIREEIEEREKYRDSHILLNKLKEDLKRLETEKSKKYLSPKKLSIPLFMIIVLGILTMSIYPILIGISLLSFYIIYIQKKIRKIDLKIKEISDRTKTLLIEAEKYREINGLKSKMEEYSKELRGREDRLKILEKEIQYFLKKLGIQIDIEKINYEYVDKLREEYIRKRDLRNELNTKINILITDVSKESEINQSIERILGEKRSMKESLKKIVLPSLPDNIEYSDELYDNIERKVNDIKTELSNIEGQLKQLEIRKNDLKKYIEENKDIKNKVKEQEKKVHELEYRYNVITNTIEILEKVSGNIRKKFVPSVEYYMNKFISKITGGRYKAVKLDENYSLKVFDSNAGRFVEKDIFSGGTVDQFLLAMRLAFLLSLLPKGKGTYPRFLFLDEPLASSDIERRENILELIEKDLRDDFEQIILITHLEDIIRPGYKYIKLEEGNIIEKNY